MSIFVGSAYKRDMNRKPKFNATDFCDYVGMSTVSFNYRMDRTENKPEVVYVHRNRKYWNQEDLIIWHNTFDNSKIKGK